MYRILIVEDDRTIADTLAAHLRRWDYEVECARDFKNVMESFAAFGPQLVILDIMLPFFNGFHWCQEIRRVSEAPVIFLSSADDNMNIVMAMNMGGDEFIEKPFDLSVVTAKIQAVIRRAYSFQAGETHLIGRRGLLLNLNDASVTYEGRRIELTKNELRILQILLENMGKIVSRDALITALWRSDEFIDDNTLTVNMSRIRRKLEELGCEGVVRTKKGIGYIIE